LGVGLTILPCKKEKCCEASKKFSRILWRRPRPKLGCGAKERKEEEYILYPMHGIVELKKMTILVTIFEHHCGQEECPSRF
jgi:hypothetical protein